MKAIILTKSQALVGTISDEKQISEWVHVCPLNKALTDEEADLIELNTGLHFSLIHYPHYIKNVEIGGIIDITNVPVNPIENNETKDNI